MIIRKYSGLLIFLLVLTSCVSTRNSTSDTEDSNNDSSSDNTDISETETSTSEEEPDPTLPEGNLSTFATDIIADPAITYVSTDYTVKSYPNGYSYPVNAQVQPTNAYLEFWHPETELSLRIVANKQIFRWIEQYGVDEQTKADLYWPVSLEVIMNSKRFVYYEVGMRMKGNTSRHHFLDDEGNIDYSINFKLSFNELWNTSEYAPFGLQKTWTEAGNPEWTIRDGRTFMGDDTGKLGLKKIDIKWNKSKDDSLVVQPFIFSTFQKHGVISQNSTLTKLKINGTRMGIVTINEPIDKHLLRRYVSKAAAKGELYKVGWGRPSPNEDYVKGSLRYEDLRWNGENLIVDSIIGEEDKTRNYVPTYDAKEFDATLAQPHAKLINLMKVLKDCEGKTPAQYVPDLEAVVDINSFLKFIAVSYMVGNIDDMRNWGNNYYIFFNPSEGNKAYFIPYDYDWGLGLTWNYGETKMYGSSPFETHYLMNTDIWQENRLFWYTILSTSDSYRPYSNITMNENYRNRYVVDVKAVSNDSFYSHEAYDNLYNLYKNTYDNKSDSDLGEISKFLNTNFMKGFITSMKGVVNSQLS